jgi:hypothetical protein
MMPIAAQVAARFLEEASGLYAHHSCNDTDPKMFEGLTHSQIVDLEIGYNEYNIGYNSKGDHIDYIPFNQIPDYAWMSYLAAILSGEWELEE